MNNNPFNVTDKSGRKEPVVFDKNTTMYIEPLRNEYWKTYQDVITFSNMPEGPIRHLVKILRPPKLSPFQSQSQSTGCKYVLLRTSRSSLKNPQCYMTSGDLPSVMDYLHEHGYVVDTHTPANMSMAGIYLGDSNQSGYSGVKRCVAIISYS